MSLFVVNRYLGDDAVDADNANADKRDDLNFLLRKIEERRRLKEKDGGVAEAKSEDALGKKRNKTQLKKLKKKEKKRATKLGTDVDKVGKSDEGDLSESGPSSTSITDETSKTNLVKKTNVSEFTVLGGHNFKKKIEVKRFLPGWLANPFRISPDLKCLKATVEDIPELDKIIVTNLKKNKVVNFFPVQKEVIPWILKERKKCSAGLKLWPRDLCVSAPTGSGKTLAFVLPVIQSLKACLIRRVRALVVLPVQDLAAQVAKVFVQYAQGTGLRVLTVTGKAMPLQAEQTLLVRKRIGVGYESRVDIVVTTPGRLVEHLKETPGFDLSHLRFLIIDEADRVIDNVKNDWLYHLENHLTSAGIKPLPALTVETLRSHPLRPQKLLFSATLTQDPEKLKQLNLFQPRLFTSVSDGDEGNEDGAATQDDFAGKLVLPAELKQKWMVCNAQLKPLILYHILATKGWRGVVCFTHYTDATHRLARLLSLIGAACRLNITVEEVSSEISFNARNQIVNDFKFGKIDVLVCSDAFARGMDITGVRYVILYSPPKHLKNYIHQVGRTARAGASGTALTLLTQPQVRPFHQMLKMSSFTGKLKKLEVNEKELTYLEEPYRNSLLALKNEATGEQEEDKEKLKIRKRKRKLGTNFTNHSEQRSSINNNKPKRCKR